MALEVWLAHSGRGRHGSHDDCDGGDSDWRGVSYVCMTNEISENDRTSGSKRYFLVDD